MHFRPASPAPVARTVAGLAALAAALLLTGCKGAAHPSASSAPPPPASSSPSTQLAAVATLAMGAEYEATYTAHSDAQGSQPARTTTIEVYRTTTATRLDVDEQPTHVLIQVDATGTSSCTVTPGTPSACVLLAGPDASIPAGVPDPGLQHTFTSTLQTLASGSNLTVAAALPLAAAHGVPAATCFALIATPAGSSASPGTYCFSAGGIVVQAHFRSSLLQLISIGSQPAASDFSLPASPQPVSTASATP